jgi:hypothetical protein
LPLFITTLARESDKISCSFQEKAGMKILKIVPEWDGFLALT